MIRPKRQQLEIEKDIPHCHSHTQLFFFYYTWQGAGVYFKKKNGGGGKCLYISLTLTNFIGEKTFIIFFTEA